MSNAGFANGQDPRPVMIALHIMEISPVCGSRRSAMSDDPILSMNGCRADDVCSSVAVLPLVSFTMTVAIRIRQAPSAVRI